MMMENRFRILIALIILLTFLNITEAIFENAETPTKDKLLSEKKVDTPQGTGTFIDIIKETFIIDFEGLPTELAIVFTLIQSIGLMLIGMIVLTFLLDAFPFTGG